MTGFWLGFAIGCVASPAVITMIWLIVAMIYPPPDFGK